LEGLKYIHSHGICHRDIKADNILVVKSSDPNLLKVKIADFNVAKKFNNRSMMTKTGVDAWLAPEIVQGFPYTEKIDLWAAGCILYFMLTGLKPFDSKHIAKLH